MHNRLDIYPLRLPMSLSVPQIPYRQHALCLVLFTSTLPGSLNDNPPDISPQAHDHEVAAFFSMHLRLRLFHRHCPINPIAVSTYNECL